MKRSILMLEHDDDDRYITQTVFEENRFSVDLHFVDTSDELFNFLDSCGTKGVPLPSIILLNHYATPRNAVDILRDLKGNPRFSHIPVVVLSGTANQDIVQRCYAMGANSFIQKPSSGAGVNEKISMFVRYWFGTVELP